MEFIDKHDMYDFNNEMVRAIFHLPMVFMPLCRLHQELRGLMSVFWGIIEETIFYQISPLLREAPYSRYQSRQRPA